MRYFIYFLFLITFFVPAVLLFFNCSFTFLSFVDYLKEFSFPLWLSFFTISWLYYKKVITDNQHLRTDDIDEKQPHVIIEELKKRNAHITRRSDKRNNAEKSIQSVEVAAAIAGLIIGVLGLIAFLSTYFITRTSEIPKKEHGHELVFAADSGQHDQFSIDKFAQMRKYSTFSLGADSLTNIKLLEQARLKINSIKDSHDTINGVHIVISDNTPYSFYIKAVDICSEKEPRVFAPNKNDIYAWYLYITPKDKRELIKIDK